VSHSAFAAEDVVTPSNTQLPEWFYQELIAIKKDVSDLDAKQVSEDEVKNLKHRLSKVETVLELSEKDLDKRLDAQDKFIDAIYASTDRFGIIVGVLGSLIAFFSFLFSWNARREAVASAKQEAQNALDGWTDNKGAEITKAFDVKLKELNQRHEKELEVIREQAEVQTADNDITEAYILANQKRDAEAIRRIHYVIQRFWESDLLRHQKILAKAMYFRGLIFYASNEPEKEIKAYDELIKQFKDNNELAIQEYVAKALMNKGITLGQLDGRSEDAIKAYDELINQFKDNDELVIQEQVAKALLNKGVRLGQLDGSEDEILVYDELINQFKDSNELVIQEQVAKALVNKGVTLGQLERPEEIKVYDEVIERFKGRGELALEVEVARALYNKALGLGKKGYIKDALVVCEEFDQRFKDRKEPQLLKIHVDLHLNKAEGIYLTQDKAAAKKAIEYAISIIPEGQDYQGHAVMEILKLMIDESSISKVFSRIESITTEEIAWSFKELKPAIEKLESPKKEQVEAITRFFEEHKDKIKLREELGL